MGLTRMHNKKTGVTYICEATNFWDREKRRTRSVWRLVGKLDPASGHIVLTGRRGKSGVPFPLGRHIEKSPLRREIRLRGLLASAR